MATSPVQRKEVNATSTNFRKDGRRVSFSGSLASTNSIGPKRAYLFLYNATSLAAWSYIFYRLISHLNHPSSSISRTALFDRRTAQNTLLARARTSYSDFGNLTRYVQTGALLEIAHVVFGLVNSGLGTTISQVASRLVIVHVILKLFPQTQTSPFFTSAVFAWSIAEMIRYATYALAVFKIKAYPLDWLRYSLFYILYPLGAGSEVALILQAIPLAKEKYARPASIALTLLLIIWPPSLAMLMSHMHAQRRKYIGGTGRTLPGKGKKRA